MTAALEFPPETCLAPLAPYATHASRSRGRLHPEPDSKSGRSPFQRDRDRIIHSGAFRKLQYKTQVFINHEGDYYRTRLTHSLEVAQITRNICRALNLDEDLGEAVALAHDLGHTCFGHTGEDALAECMKDVGGFFHNDQTVRICTNVEQRYAEFDGLNLSWETLEGIAKHNGPLKGPQADMKKHGEGVTETIAALDKVWPLELDGHAGLEAQVAALGDDIAYLSHDMDDGLRSEIIHISDIADLPLVGEFLREIDSKYPGLNERRRRHELHRRMVGALVEDVLAETRSRLAAIKPRSVEEVRAAGAPFVQFSAEMFKTQKVIRDYLFKNVYKSYRINRVRTKAFRIVKDLYQVFMSHPDTLPESWQQAIPAGASERVKARVVADYIAGMTDRFAIDEHRRLYDMDKLI
jgi:dGTPase